jgi:hypothetical protein
MPQRTPIRYAEDEFGVTDWPAWLEVMDARRSKDGHPPGPRPQAQEPSAAPVYARMNYGRWLADCECKAAVMLFRGKAGQWFWCPNCGNAAAGGKMRPVIWPGGRAQIDLDKGSLPAALANWDPAEVSIEDRKSPPNDGPGTRDTQ